MISTTSILACLLIMIHCFSNLVIAALSLLGTVVYIEYSSMIYKSCSTGCAKLDSIYRLCKESITGWAVFVVVCLFVCFCLFVCLFVL